MGDTGKQIYNVLFAGQPGSSTDPFKAAKKALTPAKPKVPALLGTTGETDAAAAMAAERERERLNRRRGRASTILTGPLGDLNPAQLGRKLLTGS
jgi:hypothetical protein